MELESWEDVDRALKALGDIDLKIAVREAAVTKVVAEVRKKGERQVGPLAKRRAALLEQLEAFSVAHRADFAPAKSRSLTHGKVGFRESTSLVVGDEAACIAQLRLRQLEHCIRTKTTHSVDRTALKGLTDEVLAGIGAKRQTEDRFYAEAARETLAA